MENTLINYFSNVNTMSKKYNSSMQKCNDIAWNKSKYMKTVKIKKNLQNVHDSKFKIHLKSQMCHLDDNHYYIGNIRCPKINDLAYISIEVDNCIIDKYFPSILPFVTTYVNLSNSNCILSGINTHKCIELSKFKPITFYCGLKNIIKDITFEFDIYYNDMHYYDNWVFKEYVYQIQFNGINKLEYNIQEGLYLLFNFPIIGLYIQYWIEYGDFNTVKKYTKLSNCFNNICISFDNYSININDTLLKQFEEKFGHGIIPFSPKTKNMLVQLQHSINFSKIDQVKIVFSKKVNVSMFICVYGINFNIYRSVSENAYNGLIYLN